MYHFHQRLNSQPIFRGYYHLLARLTDVEGATNYFQLMYHFRASNNVQWFCLQFKKDPVSFEPKNLATTNVFYLSCPKAPESPEHPSVLLVSISIQVLLWTLSFLLSLSNYRLVRNVSTATKSDNHIRRTSTNPRGIS